MSLNPSISFNHAVLSFSSTFSKRPLSTSLKSPTNSISAWIFLLISDESMSICITFAFFANSSLFPITLSLKRAPIDITKSEFDIARFASLLPCIPTSPKESGFALSIPPSPISVFSTGVFIFCANSFSSLY